MKITTAIIVLASTISLNAQTLYTPSASVSTGNVFVGDSGFIVAASSNFTKDTSINIGDRIPAEAESGIMGTNGSFIVGSHLADILATNKINAARNPASVNVQTFAACLAAIQANNAANGLTNLPTAAQIKALFPAAMKALGQ